MPISNPSAPPLVFTELLGNENHAAGAPTAWENWDISAIVPVGTQYALMAIRGQQDVNCAHGCRETGSALDRRQWASVNASVMVLVALTATRIVEIFAEGAVANAFFCVAGYWS